MFENYKIQNKGGKKVKNNQDQEKVAKEFLKLVEKKMVLMKPKPSLIFVKWRGDIYFGSLQNIALEYSSEIFYLSKTSKPLSKNFLNALKKFEPEIQTLQTDDELDLEERGHFLKKTGNRLLRLTSEQINYILNHPPRIFEI